MTQCIDCCIAAVFSFFDGSSMGPICLCFGMVQELFSVCGEENSMQYQQNISTVNFHAHAAPVAAFTIHPLCAMT